MISHGLNGLNGFKSVKSVQSVAFLLLAFAVNLPVYAKCPVSDGATLVVRAPVGDLHVETTGRDAVEVQVDSNLIQVVEKCGPNLIEFSGNTLDPTQSRGTITWKILTPKAVNLDLVAYGGGITVGDVDADVILRTTGGSVTTGYIKGQAAIITQGGSIKSMRIGGNAELRSTGGTLEVGNVGGNAEFQTTAGPIRAGNVTGSVTATGGRTIVILKAGDVKATTNAGDIQIGEAARINAKTAGGHITSGRVRGPFQGHTDSGNILLDSAASWVEASTGYGDIVVKLTPDNIDGDLHMDLTAGVGNVTVYVPQRLKATIDATVQRPAFQAQQIISDFPMNSLVPANRFYAPAQQQTILNGGGNKIRLHTSLGKIQIKKN